VNGAFIKVGFDKKHGSFADGQSACRQFERHTRASRGRRTG
jgi:hypothetical protein